MKTHRADPLPVLALTPPHRLLPQIAIAACRAGAFGVLDLGLLPEPAAARTALDQLAHGAGTNPHWGVRWDTLGTEARCVARAADILGRHAPVPLLILAGLRSGQLASARDAARGLAHAVFLEVHDLQAAQEAERAGYDGLIVKGCEAGGRVSPHSSFMLAQEFHERLDIPYWLQGGIGLHSAAAAMLAGAAGVVLCDQLWLTAEASCAAGSTQGDPFRLTAEASCAAGRTQFENLDGSETTLLGAGNTFYRFFLRSGRAKLRALELALARGEPWQPKLPGLLSAPEDALLAVGQDVAFAQPLATRFGTVGRIVSAMRDSMAGSLAQASSALALAPDSPLAGAHGTRYPIVQGPMTRVSDVGPFARAVADAGALPFLALAVMRGPQVRAMLDATRDLMGELPWGVGMLGFVPLELRQEQLAVLCEVKPPFAIIAGGRPSQARELEALGITSYLHVPSPGLLRAFLAEGARKFVFEGSECGGHTGPRSSFILWEQAIEILAAAALKDTESVQVLFAGGIHDALSAAMLSVMAAPLVARGMKVGVLMGTAYLFTEEIVSAGAIVEAFQQQALDCAETVLLQSGVGIYTRCADTPFCAEFETLRRQLVAASKSEQETLMALELMNIGRLRIASKGMARNPDPAAANGAARYIGVDPATQQKEGLYMLGEVARLRARTCHIADLHGAVAQDSGALLRQRQAQVAAPPPRAAREEIAIVGMACLFPRAQNLRQYWQNILRGVDAIRAVTDDRWRADDLFDSRRGTPDKVYSKWGGFLDDMAFDPRSHGLAPASLASIEPAQLLTLEVARRALQDAGFEQRPFPKERTACIFAVGGMNDLGTIYNFRTLLSSYLARVADLPEASRQHILDTLLKHELPKWTEDTFPGILGNVVAGRIANRLDLGGSNFTVDAACAASLAALDAGMRQLRDGDADVALVGGVDCTNSPIGFMCFAQTHALSPRGRSRPFDASADGIAISEGVGAVVLKRLCDAERDGDRIYAIVKGIGSSSDGRHRSLTAPHAPGQVRALARAYQDAGLDPASVTLVEAHGTGTALGDKSEVDALNAAFGAASSQSCAIGSVKSMIGHTKVAAGMAGLIKAALALQHRILPPTLGVEQPIAALAGAASPFYVNTETRPWLHAGRAHPRHCGVSAFGFGGTNFHAVLAEYTGSYRASDRVSLNPREIEIFSFAGTTRAAIEGAATHLLQGLDSGADLDLAQLAFALYREQHLLRHANGGHPCRLVLTATSVADLRQKLLRALGLLADHGAFRQPPGLYYRESTSDIGRVCFLFPGQGSQHVNMLRELVLALPQLHAFFGQAGQAGGGRPQVTDYIYPVPAFDAAAREAQQQALNATEIAQPALAMVEMAAFEVLGQYGLRPDFVAGHSYGEYAALWAAGVLTRDELLRLSFARGRLSAQAAPGAMAALDADGGKVAAAIARHGLRVCIANLNAPDQTIIAGAADDVEHALALLAQDGLRVRKLAVASAFHCASMASVGAPLAAELAAVRFRPPCIPVFCNVTAAPYPAAAKPMRALLARHIAEPVRFVEEIEALYQAGARVFVECGPGLVLSGLVERILGQRPHTTLAIDAPGRSGWLQLAQLLTQALAIGLPVNLEPWFAGRGLEESSLDDVFAQARARASQGPLTWRVNGGRAAPWRAPALTPEHLSHGASPMVQAVPAARTARPASPPAPAQPDSPSPHLRSNSMKNHDPRADGPPLPSTPAPIAAPPHSDAQVAQIQHGFARLLEFHSEQQRSLRQFMDFQLHLAGTALPQQQQQESLPLPLPAAPVPPAWPAPGQPGALPRAPVLPLAGAGTPPVLAQQALPLPVAAAPGMLAGAPPAAPPSVAEFQDELVQAVAQRTGYPPDMLDLDAHMEADLGIDSIKRIEIFSGLTQRYNLVGERDEESVIEDLAGFKTLNEIVAWYGQLLSQAGSVTGGETLPKKAPTPLFPSSQLREPEVESEVASEVASEAAPELASEVQPGPAGGDADPVACYVVGASAAPLDADAAGMALPTRYPMVLLGPVSDLSLALQRVLEDGGHQVRQLIPGAHTRALDALRCEVDVSSLASVRLLAPLCAAWGQPAGALINLMGLADSDAGPDQHQQDGRALFLLLKQFEADLKRSAQDGAGWLVNLTGFGGRFGLDGAGAVGIGSAATLGVAKSAAREWPALRVKCIDVAPALAPDWLAAQVLSEMRSTDTEIEVGYSAQGRWRIGLTRRSALHQHVSGWTLGKGAVLLVTGGAYGITADVTRTLAEKYHPHLVLVGRSALPGDEAALTLGVADVAELKLRLTRELQTRHAKVKPAQVDSALQCLLKERQIRANLAALRACGGKLEYHCLDVRDSTAFAALIDAVYARHGRIDGVLHGAGVISDKLIGKKPLEAYDAVFDTKVLPALLLAQKLRLSELNFLAFFSSVAGRFGNAGQCDYSAANEVLNKLAGQLGHAWPQLHALAINWGPWDAGMVSDDLRRLYAARSIRPIPAATGRRHFLEELERGARGEAEVVISASIGQIAALRPGR